MNVHHIHRFLYEHNEENYFCMRFTAFRQRQVNKIQVKDFKSLNAKT